MTSLRQQIQIFWQNLPNPGALRWAAIFFGLSALSFLLSVAAAQIFFSLAGICYAIDLLRRPRVPSFPLIKLPLALFCFFTVLSIGWAENPTIGWTVVRKLTLFLIILLTVNLIVSVRHLTMIYQVMFVESAIAGLVAAVQFVVEYRQVRAEHPDQFYYYMTLFRVHGFMGHWMTFGGQQMLVSIALAAYLLLSTRGRPTTGPAKYWWIILVIVATSIVLNFTRGVWIGCGVASVYLVARWRPRLLWVLPALVVAGYLAAPSLLRERLGTVFHPSADPAIAVRFEMWRVGLAMIRRHPIVGVGPNNINEVYLTYLPPRTQPVAAWHEHLHDDYLQLAAERGLPCLIAWLWLMGALGWQILRIRRLLSRHGQSTWVADASLAGWLAFMAEGWFEFNFGTTPVLMVFLFMMSTPFAAEPLLTAGTRHDER
ncbi:MAG TPA: O-antigen ligase family protein [Terriglobia bacterium]